MELTSTPIHFMVWCLCTRKTYLCLVKVTVISVAVVGNVLIYMFLILNYEMIVAVVIL